MIAQQQQQRQFSTGDNEGGDDGESRPRPTSGGANSNQENERKLNTAAIGQENTKPARATRPVSLLEPRQFHLLSDNNNNNSYLSGCQLPLPTAAAQSSPQLQPENREANFPVEAAARSSGCLMLGEKCCDASQHQRGLIIASPTRQRPVNCVHSPLDHRNNLSDYYQNYCFGGGSGAHSKSTGLEPNCPASGGHSKKNSLTNLTRDDYIQPAFKSLSSSKLLLAPAIQRDGGGSLQETTGRLAVVQRAREPHHLPPASSSADQQSLLMSRTISSSALSTEYGCQSSLATASRTTNLLHMRSRQSTSSSRTDGLAPPLLGLQLHPATSQQRFSFWDSLAVESSGNNNSASTHSSHSNQLLQLDNSLLSSSSKLNINATQSSPSSQLLSSSFCLSQQASQQHQQPPSSWLFARKR